MALLDETSNVLTVSLRGLKSNVKYAEDYVKLSVAQSANTFPTAKVHILEERREEWGVACNAFTSS